jgi:hypothetical protein
MSKHIHTWTPIPMQCARYFCRCGATAYRAFTGEMRQHKQPLRRRARWTARNRTAAGGRIEPRVPSDRARERDA